MGTTLGDRRFRGVVLTIGVVMTSLVLIEGTVRVFWKVRYGIPLSRPDAVLYAIYPELWQLRWKGAELRGHDPVRLLFLGGSVLHPAWGNIEQELRERLTVALGRPVVIFNLSEIGHASRDSYVKYRLLDRASFDLVIIYHGINEVRANNAPPGTFRADYSHYAWYDGVRALESCGEGGLVLPCTLRFLAVAVKDRLGLADYVSMDSPRPEWLTYGADIKTGATFEANLRALLRLARTRDAPVLLMTFASWIPADYSSRAFRARALDYALHLSPIEMWGTVENVRAGVARHNEVIRSVVSEEPWVRLVDQDKRMPRGRRYFNDVCHLTSAGSMVFVDNMLAMVIDLLTVRRADRSRPTKSSEAAR